ncbi:50S ribosomal protein L5 [Candidatus Uhrbacteria bacterium RIFCSPHIGHO2_12_FULL_54_23]|uniref:Large ribosomal subunit protein uL5 n=3 Tax=Candidatus Uhriibacteriota TaxID=1752732 RepID=A0A1F7UI66_9BACT|nr:MAG: 50S ribosomal protein L5 [Candidatus Uhrbacteria bacterium RIFCSPHIGHO2_12_FULL_54_23]OGL83624.1 MAG: 50S ribosomal protein L5 [Candidatus Uhrbacteria bacterium RIFCSPLOWO2_01_FULL_55_36]OGL89995.1 MAG: 50S ribosomal protein L5 [Candidatus Uhrbacteria bacterium RIFCSPLOWO2_02_FULL_54_37]
MAFREHYTQKIVPALMAQFGYRNPLAAPRVDYVVVNVGVGKNRGDEKYMATVGQTLQRITGQKPIFTLAKKSIAAFKIRAGQTVGAKVTLRGRRMEDFLTKLTSVTFPRIHDFRGITSASVDRQGNLTVGLREHLAFPEIRPDEVERIHGLEVSVHTTAHTRDEGFALLKLLGFPFQADSVQ